MLTTVTTVEPPANSHSALVSTDIAATFNQDIDAASATPQNFVVHSEMRAGSVAVSAAGMTVTAVPSSDSFAGEITRVTATAGIQSTTADPVVPRVWEFRTAVGTGTGVFSDSGRNLGNHRSTTVSLGDLDGDGDLDALVANWTEQGNRVWLNNDGQLTDSGQILGTHFSAGASLGDLDGDGDLDAFVANAYLEGTNRVWLNDGGGLFSNSGQGLGNHNASAISLGDLDGDGDLDVFVANAFQANRVWLNDSTGSFSDSSQSLGNHASDGVSLGDLDGDGDLDAFVANYGANRVWLNDGGSFSDTGQSLGSHATEGVSLGDLDGDGDLDAVTANTGSQGNRVWQNNGSGVFAEVQSFGNHSSRGVSLGDLDGDGDLDVFVANSYPGYGDHVWLNDGSSLLRDSGQSLGSQAGNGVSLGDLDGDGDLDAYLANDGGFNTTWLNQNPPNEITLSVDNPTIAEAGGVATITAVSSTTAGSPITVSLAISGSATSSDDYTASASEIVIAAGATTGSITVTAIDDTLDEPDETVLVEITGIVGGTEAGSQQAKVTIEDDDEPPVPDVTLLVDNSAIAEAGGVATFEVTLSEVTTVPVAVNLGLSGTATATDDYSASGNQLVLEAGTTTASITLTALDDDIDESDETVIVDIASVTNGNEVGDQQQTVTIVDDDASPSFAVTSLELTASGFRVKFTNELNADDLNLYDTQNAGLGPADVVVTGASSGAIAGSLVVDTSAITFIKSGGPLAADTYTVTLRSAADGFKDAAAMLLDGNADGTGGDDYVSNFTIAEPADARTVSIPDFVRGPGQDVNLPADETTGIPITISDGDKVRAADVRITYDPALLEITGATAPAGGSVIVNTTTTPGVAILVFFSSAALPAGSSTFINLQATVPAGADYGGQQVLDFHSVTIGDGNDNEFPVVVDDALHFSTYFADVSGNGRVNASDAAQVARFAALIDAGFAASLNADPISVGDISGNGRINAADASRVAQFAALIDVPEIPPVPGGIRITGLVNPSPGNVGTAPIIVGPLAGPPESGNTADSEASEFRVVENFASRGSETANIDEFAVDRMMADFANSVDDEQGELGSASVFEGTLDELLSAVD